jgi:phosphatidylglycerophosphatase A
MSTKQSDILHLIKVFKSVRVCDKGALIISMWFGAGLLPGMPGTFGTAGAIPLLLLLNLLPIRYQALSLLIIIIGAIWSSHRSQSILGRVDPCEIVIDEVAGFLLTIIFIPFTLKNLIAGFFLFRFFDIFKPPPIRMIEQKVKGGCGIVFDDLAAGVYAYLSLRLFLYLIG